MFASLPISPFILVGLFVIFFLEAIDIRLAQLLFLLLSSYLIVKVRLSPILLLLGTIVLCLTMAVNFVQLEAYLGGIAVLLSLLSAQFIFQECSHNPLRLGVTVVSIWSLVTIYLLINLYFKGDVASSIEGSHNHINTLLLPFFIITSIALGKTNTDSNDYKFEVNNKFLLLSYFILALITFTLSIFMTGRTGLVLGLVGLLFVWALLRQQTKLSDFLMFCFCCVGFVSFAQIYLFMELNSGGLIKLLREKGSEDIRVDIFNHWTSMLPDITTWFGIPRNYFLSNFGVGSHNSLIQIYETLGMFGVIFFGLLVICASVSLLLRGRYLISILFAMLLFRMATDSVFNSIGILTTFWLLIFSAGGDQFARSILNRQRPIHMIKANNEKIDYTN